jgi:N-acetylglucosamine-6-phosphate deacetylase
MLLSGGKIVSCSGVLDPGWVRVSGALIEAVGADYPVPARPGEATIDLSQHWVLPGLVDLHCHGGRGTVFRDSDPGKVISAMNYHRRSGTTSLWASLSTTQLDDMLRSIALLADLTGQNDIDGIHLEGPFLSPARRGAQNLRYLLAPDRQIMARLLKAGRGAVRMVTIAPELPGAFDLIRQVADTGAIPAMGHTDATYEQAQKAVDIGVRVATHLFNGMRPVHHREPGPVLAALERPEVYCELIADGTHLHPAVIRRVVATKGSNRVVFVTDATVAAGMRDGTYWMGGREVVVRSGAARLVEDGSLTGSTITASSGLSWAVKGAGLAIDTAVRMAAETPAALAGLSREHGSIRVGARADLLICDGNLALKGVMSAGKWLTALCAS